MGTRNISVGVFDYEGQFAGCFEISKICVQFSAKELTEKVPQMGPRTISVGAFGYQGQFAGCFENFENLCTVECKRVDGPRTWRHL